MRDQVSARIFRNQFSSTRGENANNTASLTGSLQENIFRFLSQTMANRSSMRGNNFQSPNMFAQQMNQMTFGGASNQFMTDQQLQGGTSSSVLENTHNMLKSILGDLGNAVSQGVETAGSTIKSTSESLKGMYNTFISQFKGSSNTNEDASHLNGNCGPACLAMLARANGILSGGADNANGQIEQMRNLMGASTDENEWTNMDQLNSALGKMGLDTKYYRGNASVESIRDQLSSGKRLLVAVDPKEYGTGSQDSGHFVNVVGMNGNNFIIQDPAHDRPIEVSQRDFQRAMQDQGNWMISV